MSAEMARPLLVSSDPGITDAVLAVASEANIDVTLVPDVGSAGPMWNSAPLVLIDGQQVQSAEGLLSRRGVVIVTRAITDADTWRRLVAVGAERIVELPLGAPWLYERLGRSLESESASGLLVVAGAAGGAGTSTLAAALARHSTVGEASGVLVDLDPGGGGIDLMLGGEGAPGARWDELAGIGGRVDDRILIQALPVADGLAVLSWPAGGEVEPDDVAVGHVLDALARAQSRVVVDGGRGLDRRFHVALARAESLVVLVPLRVRAVTAARRLLQRVPPHVQPLLVAREPAPGGLTVDDVSEALGIAVIATVTEDRRRATVEELGGPAPHTATWRRLCDAVLAHRAELAA
ncbi:MAG: septum site-determining protein Ssd [Chloroflexota bacterium]